MDFLVKHLKPLRRHFAAAPPIDGIGFLPNKTNRTFDTFESYNFSFILEGRGDYILRGKRHEVIAPCVLTQWPGEPMDYGPDGYWVEVYFIYNQAMGEIFRQKGFWIEGRPLWQIADPAIVLNKARELQELATDTDGAADRHDLLCESMVMESLIAAAPAPPEPGEAKIRAAAARIRRDFTAEYDFDALARECGMSLSTFRRRWQKYLGLPPARYQARLLQQDACRMLVETTSPIKEIALTLGFGDPLYFSRRFHQLTGQTPTVYRHQNQLFHRP